MYYGGIIILEIKLIDVLKLCWVLPIYSSPMLLYLAYLLPKIERKVVSQGPQKSLYACECQYLQPLILYLLQNAGVQFPQSAQVVESNHASSQPSSTGSIPNREQAPPRHEAVVPQAESKTVPESR